MKEITKMLDNISVMENYFRLHGGDIHLNSLRDIRLFLKSIVDAREAEEKFRLINHNAKDPVEITERKLAILMGIVLRRMGIQDDSFIGRTRVKPVANARKIFSLIAKKNTSASLSLMGRMMGGRDHSTILHQIDMAEDHYLTEPDFRKMVDVIRQEFIGATSGIHDLDSIVTGLVRNYLEPENEVI